MMSRPDAPPAAPPAATPGATRADDLPSPRRAAVTRGIGFLALWAVLMPSAKPADVAFGAFAVLAATWLSLRLLPPASGCLRFGALLALVPHFLWESARAGIDVARRAFSPSLPLSPGFVSCPLGFAPGYARNTFSSITSLLPGSLPADEEDGVLVYHALDLEQPVVAQLRQEERLLAKALVAGTRDD